MTGMTTTAQPAASPTGNAQGTEKTPNATPSSGQPQSKAQGAVSTGAKDASSADVAKEAAAEARRRLKIDNEEVDEDEVIKIYKERKGHQRVATKELQEGRAAKKQAEEFISMMKDKGRLFEVIQKLGHDPRKLAEEYLSSQLEEDLLDPREKELRSAKTELQKYKELEKAQKEALQKKHDDEMKAKFSEKYTAEFVESLKTTGIPATKSNVGKMASYIARAAKINFEMTPIEAAKLVREDIERDYAHLWSESDAETLAKLLGEQNLQKIRAWDTARLKDPSAHLKTPEQQDYQPRKREPHKRMTPQEWRAFNKK